MEVGSGLGHNKQCTLFQMPMISKHPLTCVTAGSSAQFPNKGSMPPMMLSAQS